MSDGQPHEPVGRTEYVVGLEREVERLRQRVSDMEDGLRFGEEACARLVEERDKARADARGEIQKLRDEKRQLRRRLVECRPWVGVCPLPNTPGFSEMLAIRDIADDTLDEVKE